MADLPDDIDSRLWVRTEICDDIDFLYGNCHTFPGRMAAFCPHMARDYCVSKNEIRASSPEADMWIAGFLSGNEPGGDAMFGDAWGEVESKEDMRLEQWRQATEEFRRTGVWRRKQ